MTAWSDRIPLRDITLRTERDRETGTEQDEPATSESMVTGNPEPTPREDAQ